MQKAMSDAEEATSDLLEPDSDDESESSGRRRTAAPFRVTEEQLRPIASAAKRARVAGSTTPKVRFTVRRAKGKGIRWSWTSRLVDSCMAV